MSLIPAPPMRAPLSEISQQSLNSRSTGVQHMLTIQSSKSKEVPSTPEPIHRDRSIRPISPVRPAHDEHMFVVGSADIGDIDLSIEDETGSSHVQHMTTTSDPYDVPPSPPLIRQLRSNQPIRRYGQSTKKIGVRKVSIQQTSNIHQTRSQTRNTKNVGRRIRMIDQLQQKQ